MTDDNTTAISVVLNESDQARWARKYACGGQNRAQPEFADSGAAAVIDERQTYQNFA